MPRRIVALAGSTHPGPAVAVTVVAVVLAVGAGLDPWRIVLLGLAVAANQASVGLSNDAIDADRDIAVGRRDKPVARGDIARSTVWRTALISAIVAVALTLPLGLPATVAHAVFIASAWSYNLGVKNTAVSVVPYIVSFGILPLVVTLAASPPAPAAWWAIGVGALLGIAAHLANVLPDLDDDRRTGVRGLPHRLGARGSGLLTWGVLLLAATLLVAGPGVTPVGLAGLALNAVIAASGTALVLTRPPSRTLFRLIIAAALVDVVLLAIAGPF